MTDFLGGLIERARGTDEAIAPRVLTRFEPAPEEVPPVAADAVAAPPARSENDPPPRLDARFAAIDAALRKLSAPPPSPAPAQPVPQVTIEPRLERVERVTELRTRETAAPAPPPQTREVRFESKETHETRETREVVHERERAAPAPPPSRIESNTATRIITARHTETIHERHERTPGVTSSTKEITHAPGRIESHELTERITEPVIVPAPAIVPREVTHESSTHTRTHHHFTRERQTRERRIERRITPQPLQTLAPAAPPPVPEPSIHISIGRIEVRAQITPEKRVAAPAPAQRSSLDEYMQRREGSGR